MVANVSEMSLSSGSGEYGFVTVAVLSELAEGIGRCVRVAGKEIALFRIGPKVYAVDDHCPHQDASLAEGDLEETTLMCPLHGWTFDITDGRVLNGEKCVPVYEVQIEGEEVRVRVPR